MFQLQGMAMFYCVFQITASDFNVIFLYTVYQNLNACRIYVFLKKQTIPPSPSEGEVIYDTCQTVAVLGRRQRREKFKHSISLFPVVFFTYSWQFLVMGSCYGGVG